MNFNSNQRSKVIQGLRSFKDTLPTKIKKIINKKGTIYPEILDNWKHFVGNDLFKFSFPIKYKNSNKINNSTLEIMIKRGKEIDIEYSKNKIIDKINAYFGYKVLEKIKIVTFDRDETYNEEVISNESKKKFHSNIKNVKDESLKRSLSNLIKVFKSK
jgi:hypothetical protein